MDAVDNERVVVLTWSLAVNDSASNSTEDDEPELDIAAAIDAPCVFSASGDQIRALSGICPVTGSCLLVALWTIFSVTALTLPAGAASATNPHAVTADAGTAVWYAGIFYFAAVLNCKVFTV